MSCLKGWQAIFLSSVSLYFSRIMKVTIETSKMLKPLYHVENTPSITEYIPLSVFDKASFDVHVPIIYAYRAPNPSNEVIKTGLEKVLSEYREWAGRLGQREGERVIFLNDKGVKYVEASVDCKLDSFMPLKPSPSLLIFHPDDKGIDELLQVQLTRFCCGSLVIGVTLHHMVADGHSMSKFMVTWGKACRGVDISPLPLRDRTIFAPRNPPRIEHEHRGVEFTGKKSLQDMFPTHNGKEDIVVHKVHFTLDFLAKLKAKSASSILNGYNKGKVYFTTFETLTAHLWRTITKARALNSFETTRLRIAVDGRKRMDPPVPDEYFGNVVLWAFPSARVKDLLHEPLSYACSLIHDAIKRVNDNYYKSFIDFASHKVKEEGLVPTADAEKSILCPEIEIDSWLRFPFYDLDFGGGKPFIFMPSYCPIEGLLFLLPSYLEDGSVDAFIALSSKNIASFKEDCYSVGSI